MKIKKYIIIFILGVIGVILILPFFQPSEFQIEKSVIINKPRAEVYNYVKYLKNQNQYSKWAKMDPKMKVSFYGKDAKIGFISAWESEMDEVGSGEQEIMDLYDEKRINYEIRFKEPVKAVAYSYINTESLGEDKTKVSWGYQAQNDYTMRFFNVFMKIDQMIGNDLDIGLKNLKELLEKRK